MNMMKLVIVMGQTGHKDRHEYADHGDQDIYTDRQTDRREC